MDVKLWLCDVGLENWQTAQMSLLGKSPGKYSFGMELSASARLWSVEVWFSIQISWDISLKPIKSPGKLEFIRIYGLTVELYFFRESLEFFIHLYQGFLLLGGTGGSPITTLSPHKSFQKTIGKTIAYCSQTIAYC